MPKNGPHEQLLWWQAKMRTGTTGPKHAKFKNHADSTALTATHENLHTGTVSRHKHDNTRITRRMRRHTITALITRINRAHNPPTWARNLANGLTWWLHDNPHVDTYTITSLTNGQWRMLSHVR